MELTITKNDIDAYERDGAICLRGAFSDHWLTIAAEGIAKDIAEPGPLHTMQSQRGEPGFFLTDFCMAQRIAEFRTFVVGSPAGEIAARIMRANHVDFFYDAIWVKDRGTPKRTRWHQDQPYYSVDGDQFCVIWLPLDPVPKEVCLELIRGSHRWGRWFQPELTRDGRDLYPEGSPYERMPDIEGDRKSYDILSWDMQPGDCIVFHALTVHGAPGNPSQQRGRRALSTFWMGDDATYAKRPGMVRPAFHGHGLKPGAPMECDYFPRVWPRTDETRVLKSARFTDPDFTVSV